MHTKNKEMKIINNLYKKINWILRGKCVYKFCVCLFTAQATKLAMG